MMNDLFRHPLREIAKHYGLESQKIKTCEECAELIQALLKDDKDHIAEEMADVEIMLEQLKYLYQNYCEVTRWTVDKLKRQLERMKNDQ